MAKGQDLNAFNTKLISDCMAEGDWRNQVAGDEDVLGMPSAEFKQGEKTAWTTNRPLFWVEEECE